jgi:hypothetical protein
MKGIQVAGYVDQAGRAKFEHIKAYYKEKNPGVPLSDSATIGYMIEDAYQKILGAQTNAHRMTMLIERVEALTEKVEDNTQAIKRLAAELRKGGKDV